jgi:hypothetical protein
MKEYLLDTSFSSNLLFWLQLVSFSITNTLAVIGLLNDFKDKKTNSLTRWGRINLAGIILSFIVGVAAQAINQHMQKASSDEAKQQMETLTSQNVALLQRVADLIGKNDVILDSSRKSLDAEGKIYSATEQTLTTASKTLLPAGDSIQIRYAIQISMLPTERPFAMDKIHADIFHAEIKKLLSETGTQRATDPAGQGITIGGLDGDEIDFDGHSQLAKESGLTQVPFTISIWKGKPLFGREIKAGEKSGNAKMLRSYIWSGSATAELDAAGTAWVSSQIPYPSSRFTPLMFYHKAKDAIIQVPLDRAVFRFSGNGAFDADLQSVLDFGGLYVEVQSTLPYPVKFCQFDLQIGPRWAIMPLSEADTDGGTVRYQLPKDMSQSLKAIYKNRIAQHANCDATN